MSLQCHQASIMHIMSIIKNDNKFCVGAQWHAPFAFKATQLLQYFPTTLDLGCVCCFLLKTLKCLVANQLSGNRKICTHCIPISLYQESALVVQKVNNCFGHEVKLATVGFLAYLKSSCRTIYGFTAWRQKWPTCICDRV